MIVEKSIWNDFFQLFLQSFSGHKTMKNKICQSCAMPLLEDNYGTNINATKNEKYCKFCFNAGKFVIPDLTLETQIERLAEIAVEQFRIPKEDAIQMAKTNLPKLARWQ
jgi:hypothetical protein